MVHTVFWGSSSSAKRANKNKKWKYSEALIKITKDDAESWLRRHGFANQCELCSLPPEEPHLYECRKHFNRMCRSCRDALRQVRNDVGARTHRKSDFLAVKIGQRVENNAMKQVREACEQLKSDKPRKGWVFGFTIGTAGFAWYKRASLVPLEDHVDGRGFKYDEQKTAKPSDFLCERVTFARIINGTIAPRCAMFGEVPAMLRDERTKLIVRCPFSHDLEIVSRPPTSNSSMCSICFRRADLFRCVNATSGKCAWRTCGRCRKRGAKELLRRALNEDVKAELASQQAKSEHSDGESASHSPYAAASEISVSSSGSRSLSSQAIVKLERSRGEAPYSTNGEAASVVANLSSADMENEDANVNDSATLSQRKPEQKRRYRSIYQRWAAGERDGLHQCHTCERIYSRADKLAGHKCREMSDTERLLLYNPELKVLSCPKCGQEFARSHAYKLKKHKCEPVSAANEQSSPPHLEGESSANYSDAEDVENSADGANNSDDGADMNDSADGADINDSAGGADNPAGGADINDSAGGVDNSAGGANNSADEDVDMNDSDATLTMSPPPKSDDQSVASPPPHLRSVPPPEAEMSPQHSPIDRGTVVAAAAVDASSALPQSRSGEVGAVDDSSATPQSTAPNVSSDSGHHGLQATSHSNGPSPESHTRSDGGSGETLVDSSSSSSKSSPSVSLPTPNGGKSTSIRRKLTKVSRGSTCARKRVSPAWSLPSASSATRLLQQHWRIKRPASALEESTSEGDVARKRRKVVSPSASSSGLDDGMRANDKEPSSQDKRSARAVAASYMSTLPSSSSGQHGADGVLMPTPQNDSFIGGSIPNSKNGGSANIGKAADSSSLSNGDLAASRAIGSNDGDISMSDIDMLSSDEDAGNDVSPEAPFRSGKADTYPEGEESEGVRVTEASSRGVDECGNRSSNGDQTMDDEDDEDDEDYEDDEADDEDHEDDDDDEGVGVSTPALHRSPSRGPSPVPPAYSPSTNSSSSADGARNGSDSRMERVSGGENLESRLDLERRRSRSRSPGKSSQNSTTLERATHTAVDANPSTISSSSSSSTQVRHVTTPPASASSSVSAFSSSPPQTPDQEPTSLKKPSQSQSSNSRKRSRSRSDSRSRSSPLMPSSPSPPQKKQPQFKSSSSRKRSRSPSDSHPHSSPLMPSSPSPPQKKQPQLQSSNSRKRSRSRSPSDSHSHSHSSSSSPSPSRDRSASRCRDRHRPRDRVRKRRRCDRRDDDDAAADRSRGSRTPSPPVGDASSPAPSPPVEVTDEHLGTMLRLFDLDEYHAALRAGKWTLPELQFLSPDRERADMIALMDELGVKSLRTKINFSRFLTYLGQQEPLPLISDISSVDLPAFLTTPRRTPTAASVLTKAEPRDHKSSSGGMHPRSSSGGNSRSPPGGGNSHSSSGSRSRTASASSSNSSAASRGRSDSDVSPKVQSPPIAPASSPGPQRYVIEDICNREESPPGSGSFRYLVKFVAFPKPVWTSDVDQEAINQLWDSREQATGGASRSDSDGGGSG